MLKINTGFLLVFMLVLPVYLNAAAIQQPATGQLTCYDGSGIEIICSGTGQDGEKHKGVAWPDPRFTDNGNGTVTDNLTRLIWLKNANCFGMQIWHDAVSSSHYLFSGTCGLSDGSISGQWRLPNRKELQSLVDRSQYNPALPSGHPFSNVQSDFYWSSSYATGYAGLGWSVYMHSGFTNSYDKNRFYFFVWPVRDGS